MSATVQAGTTQWSTVARETLQCRNCDSKNYLLLMQDAGPLLTTLSLHAQRIAQMRHQHCRTAAARYYPARLTSSMAAVQEYSLHRKRVQERISANNSTLPNQGSKPPRITRLLHGSVAPTTTSPMLRRAHKTRTCICTNRTLLPPRTPYSRLQPAPYTILL